MFETNNTSRHEVMAITSMQAIKLHKVPTEDGRRQTQNGSETQGSAGQSLTMGQAEKLLKSLVEEGWFEKSQKGYYSLSPRALMELRGWLLETYNDVDEEEDEETAPKRIKQCFACKEIITTVSRATGTRMNEWLTLVTGPAMSETVLPLPIARHMHAKLLPNSEVEKLSVMRDRLDGQRLRWGESGRQHQSKTEKKWERSGRQSSNSGYSGRRSWGR